MEGGGRELFHHLEQVWCIEFQYIVSCGWFKMLHLVFTIWQGQTYIAQIHWCTEHVLPRWAEAFCLRKIMHCTRKVPAFFQKSSLKLVLPKLQGDAAPVPPDLCGYARNVS